MTPGQVALAWVQQNADAWGVAVAPIPGTTRLRHLEENVAALGVRLDTDELDELDRDELDASTVARSVTES